MNLNQIKQEAREEFKQSWIETPCRGVIEHEFEFFDAALNIFADHLVDEIEKLVLAKWCQHDTDTPCASCFKTQDILRETFTRFKGENHD